MPRFPATQGFCVKMWYVLEPEPTTAQHMLGSIVSELQNQSLFPLNSISVCVTAMAHRQKITGNFYEIFSPSTGGSRGLTQACTASTFNYWAISQAPSSSENFWVYVQVYMHVEASDNFGIITQEPPTLFSQRWSLIGLGLANLVKLAGWRAPKSCLCPLSQCWDNKHIPKLLVSVFWK